MKRPEMILSTCSILRIGNLECDMGPAGRSVVRGKATLTPLRNKYISSGQNMKMIHPQE